jgi:hypothetical protein
MDMPIVDKAQAGTAGSSIHAGPPASAAVYGRDLVGSVPNSRGFAALLSAFRSSGGVVRTDEFARMLEARHSGDSSVQLQIGLEEKILIFEWHGTAWVPMFQFDARDLSIKPGVQKVLEELFAVFDGWNLAVWFMQPNSWLDDKKPIDILDTNLPAVVAAARADRFVARG